MTKFRKKMVWKYNRKKLSEKGVLIRMMFHDEWLIDMEIERANVLVWMWMSVCVHAYMCGCRSVDVYMGNTFNCLVLNRGLHFIVCHFNVIYKSTTFS